MAKKKINAVKIALIIIYILFILLSVVVIVMLTLKLIGRSPTTITIISWVVGVILTFQILIATILFQVKEDLGKLKEFKININRDLDKIKKELSI